MSTSSITTEDKEVNRIILDIKTETACAFNRIKKTEDSFRKIGKLLIELKGKLPHGSFMADVETLTGIPHRSATRYMSFVSSRLPGSRRKEKNAMDYADMLFSAIGENGQVANLPPPTPSPSPSPTPSHARASLTIVEFEAMETEAQDDDEIEPLVVDGSKDEVDAPALAVVPDPKMGRIPKYIPSEGLMIAATAISVMGRVNKSDTQFAPCMERMIEYCQAMLTGRTSK